MRTSAIIVAAWLSPAPLSLMAQEFRGRLATDPVSRLMVVLSRTNIAPGVTWPVAITDAINHCRAMVIVFSSHANQSPHMAREIEGADTRRVAILSVRGENDAPAGIMEYFSETGSGSTFMSETSNVGSLACPKRSPVCTQEHHKELFNFKVDRNELSGTASYVGGKIEGDKVTFTTKSITPLGN
jgi:TIR domain